MSVQQDKFATYLIVYGPMLCQFGLLLAVSSEIFDIAIIYTLVIFFLSESHFAATYLFFVSEENRRWFASRRLRVLQLLTVGAVGIVIGLVSISTLVFVASIVSGFHVTRQSIGIRKIVSRNDRDRELDLFMYFTSFCCLALTGFRFLVAPYVPQSVGLFGSLHRTLNSGGLYLGLAIGAICACLIVGSGFYRLRGAKLATVVHGGLTYAPYLFFENQVLGHLVSVSAHWVQYLFIQIFVFDTRFAKSTCSVAGRSLGQRRRRNGAIALVSIIAYSAVMTMIWVKNFSLDENSMASRLIIIPVVLQLSHYLIDAHIWRFRDPFLAKSVGVKLKKLSVA
jgi:hypothetical protein